MLSFLAGEIDRYIGGYKGESKGLGMSIYYPLLYSVVLGLECKMVFEFGLGMSSKVMLEALKETGGRLISVDVRGEGALNGSGGMVEIGPELRRSWRVLNTYSIIGMDLLKDEVFDFVLHDGAHTKDEVDRDIRRILPRLREGGILAIHDTTHPLYDLKEGIVIPRTHNKIQLPGTCGLTLV